MKKIIYLFSLTALFLTFSFVFIPVINGHQDENQVVSCDAGVCVLSNENNTSNDQAKEEKSSELKPHYAIAATAAASHAINDHSVEIVSVANFSEALAKIYNDTYKPEKTLIVFDIDNTITTSHNIHARCYSINPEQRKQIEHHTSSSLSEEEWHKVSVCLWQLSERVLTDQNLPHIITMFKNQGSTVVALTASETGSFGLMEDMEHWRYSLLNHFGITMTDNLPNMKFTQLKSFRSNYPSLYKGILSTNRVSKAELLKAFIETLDEKPECIIMFDDTKHHLDGVASMCQKNNIQCHLFHYKGAEVYFKEHFNCFDSAYKVRVLIGHDRLENHHYFDKN